MTASNTQLPQKPLLGKIRLEGIIHVETGLHIGAGDENLDIGGVDKLVIRDPITRYPYLPGSSIKGKLRSILELSLSEPHEPLNRVTRTGGMNLYRHECDHTEPWRVGSGQGSVHEGARDCRICRMFGSTGVDCWTPQTTQQIKGSNHPARLIVRDCHLLNDAELKQKIDTGLFMTEWKFENSLDRITAAANPRQIERIAAGSKFKFELVYTIENREQVIEDLTNLVVALGILQDDALGGHGSRGYGKVTFKTLKFFGRTREQYLQPSGDYEQPFAEFETLSDLFKQFGNLTGGVQKLLPGGQST
jgi:CRISPR-associated protein Csm3